MRSVRKVFYFFCEKMKQWSVLVWGDIEPSYTRLNFSCLSIASVDGKQYLSEVMFRALVRFSSLEKYPTFRQEQLEVAGSHIRRERSLANHRSLVFCKEKKSLNQVRVMCWRLSWWRRQLPVDHNSGLLHRTKSRRWRRTSWIVWPCGT